jgi:flagellar basal body-associated protein FliL
MNATNNASAPSERKPWRVVLVSVLVVLGIGGAAVVSFALAGVGPFGSDSGHPPCDQLPTTAEAEEALSSHSALADQLKAQGGDVRVSVGSPCGEDSDQALIEVTYTDEASHDRIVSVLNENDGFGVPVYLHER